MSDISTERVILAALVKNADFLVKVLPYIKEEYFEDSAEARVFTKISDFTSKYNALIDKSTLMVGLKTEYSFDEQMIDRSMEVANDIFAINPTSSMEWLEETTEGWVRDRAIFNAINAAIQIYQGKDKQLTVSAIPDILTTAISISFDDRIGSDYFDNALERFDYYTNPATKIPFLIPEFNEITCGGIPTKTLNILLAGINVGKSLGLVSLACDYARQGYDVLYISMEMREELVLQRMDANILDVNTNSLAELGRERFVNKIAALREKTMGRIVVKEFPPGGATALDIKRAIADLRLKRNFKPVVVMVDYIQIIASYRMQYGTSGSYYYYKAVAEELRKMAVEEDIIVWTASQFNRGGQDASDVNMGDVAESMAIAATADGMWGLIRTEELDQMGQLLVKQLKTRYANKATKLRFTIGVNVDKQQLYGLEEGRGAALINSSEHVRTNQEDLKKRFLDFST